MRPFHLLLASLAVCAAPAAAQVGTCERGTAIVRMETADLSVPIRPDGGLFSDWYLRPEEPFYYHRRGDAQTPVYIAHLWVSGFVDSTPRVAAATFDRDEFWPGPLLDADAPPADCSAFDRVWVVSRSDIERYLATGVATADLAEWPAHLGAPVLDGDGDPSTYDLAAGDQPDLVGDVAAWWVMNDAGNVHTGTRSEPVGVEVRGHAFAFEVPSFASPRNEALRHASFVRYEVVNRRDRPVDSLRVSMWFDVDLGNFNDDFVGTDTLAHLTYVYNADDLDDGPAGYGPAPPAWGAQVLDGFIGLPNGRDDDHDGAVDELGEESGMTTSPVALKNVPGGTGDPVQGLQFLNMQRGRLDSGAPVRAYGTGADWLYTGEIRGDTTIYAYPADPARREFWSEMNADGEGTPNRANDHRMVLTTGPGRLAAGESASVTFAFPFAFGRDHLHSVTKLRTIARAFREAYGEGFPSRRVEGPTGPPLPDARSLARVRPNPGAGGQAAILALPEPAAVRAVVLDALGRTVAVVASGTLPAGERALRIPDGLPPGAYLLRVAVERGRSVAVPFTVLR